MLRPGARNVRRCVRGAIIDPAATAIIACDSDEGIMNLQEAAVDCVASLDAVKLGPHFHPPVHHAELAPGF
jgi:hypothetical protein